MAVKLFIIMSQCFQMMFCLLHNSEDGVTIKYSAQFGNVCLPDEGKFALLYGLSIGQCVQECGLRKHCKALNLKRLSNVCELFSSDNGAGAYQGVCVSVLSDDIEVNQKPCDDCDYGKVCDTTSKQCMIKECVNLVPLNNGKILGNMRNVGSKIRFKCDDGYSLRKGIGVAECTASGAWTATAECLQDCGPLPDMIYGAKSVTATTHGGIATYSCNYGYQHVTGDLIRTCIDGTWDGDEPTCKITDCGKPAVVSHGSVYAPVTTHGATATYTCDEGYQITAGDAVRICTDGFWFGTIPVCSPIHKYNTGSAHKRKGGTHLNLSTLNEGCADTNLALTSTNLSVEVQRLRKLWIMNGSIFKRQCSDSIANVGCYYAGQSTLFAGTRQTTINGRTCQRWDSQYPHTHTRTSPDLFPSGDVSANENYCRDADYYGEPWCYTTDPNVRWESCGIPVC